MKGYIIRYEKDLVCVTNDLKMWLKENNKQRLEDGEKKESIDIFDIEEVELNIYI